jgi:hypothetical protein
LLLVFGIGVHALAPSFKAVGDIPWTLDGFWKTWADQSTALIWGAAALLGLAGWTESLKVFWFGKEVEDESGPLCFGASLALFSLFVFGLGMNGLLFSPLVALFFLVQVPNGFRLLSNPWLAGWKTWQKNLLLFSLLPWLFEYFSPPIVWDAVLDHFRFAREIARLHQIPFHWVNHTGDIPKGAELIWAGFWVLGGEGLARLSSALALVGALYLGIVLARQWKVPAWPLLLILTACPFWLAIFSWGYDEGLLALYEILAFVALESAFRRKNQPVGFGLSLFFLGAALGVKYTAVFAWAGMAAVFLFEKLWNKKTVEFNWKWAIFILIPCVPWLLRNDLSNGNPFYPMATAWFGGPMGYNASLESDLWTDTGASSGWSLGGALKTVWLDFGTPSNQVGAPLAPLLLMGLPLWWKTGKLKGVGPWFIFSMVFLGVWIIFCTNLRHAAGGLLALALVSGAAWSLGLKYSTPLLRWVFGFGFLLSLGMVWINQLNTTSPYGVSLGFQNPLERLKRNYDADFDTFCAYETIEKNSAGCDKTLAFALYQTYPLRRTAFVDFFWKKPIFLNWASQCETADQLAQKLRREGITTFLYQRMEAAYMSRKEKDFELSGMPPAEYVRFWQFYTRPLALYENSSLYQVLSRPLERPRNLTDLPGLEEAWLAPLLASEQRGDWQRAYQEAVDLTKAYPGVAVGWERSAYEAGHLGLWQEAAADGQRAQDLGIESLDLCDTMSLVFASLHRPREQIQWRQRESDRACWLEGLKGEALSFETR